MNTELVSVIIPTYNRADCIERAIDSALAQTHPAVDIIVVDDGSTDETGKRIASRYSNAPQVRYLWQANQGVATARNRGLAIARGDYVAFLDSDDVWKPWKLELQLSCLRAIPEAGMIWTDMEAITPDNTLVSSRYLHTMYDTYRLFREEDLFSNIRTFTEVCPHLASLAPEARLYWGDIFSPMVMGNLVHTSTVLMRRERLERIGGFNEALKVSGEDYDFHLRTCREGPVAFVNVSSIQYQIGRSDQLTQPRHGIHIARNFLETIESVLKNDRHRINLSPQMIASVRSGAHAWIGSLHFELGEYGQARMHIRQSLHHRPWQFKLWCMYVLSLLPGMVCRCAISGVSAVKRVLSLR